MKISTLHEINIELFFLVIKFRFWKGNFVS